MRRRLLILGATVGAVAIATAVTTAVLIAGGWTDTQSTSGNVTISSSVPDLLHICEPTTPGANDPTCPGGDDTGANEIIFELDEQLLPGGPTAIWDFTLKNLSGAVRWDVTSGVVTWTETLDPGSDCNEVPSLQIFTTTGDDDHVSGVNNYVPLDGGSMRTVHVEPNAADDMQLRVALLGTFPIECVGNAWDLNIDWTVDVH